jgi:argininosuccinate lyase
MKNKPNAKGSKLWGGRFSETMAESVEKFTSSINFDNRMYWEDIQGSIGWANALKRAKVITAAEASKIIKGLKSILNGLESGKIKLNEELEDIHMNVEYLLISKIGEVGKKLHTGRSRNDQVATDVRMFVREEIVEIILGINELLKGIVVLAESNINVIMPGYTHMQQAQPVLLAHHLMAYFEMFSRDKDRFIDAIDHIDVMPLGSGALAGTAYPIDRAALAKELGFSKISANSLDAVSDRDFIAEVIFCASMTMMHLSRICEELIIWSTSEFGFVTIGDAYTTGSSIMPQKKNPDVAELIRGKTGSVYGALFTIMTLLKGLPLTYDRDLQEDKAPVFSSIDTLKSSLAIFAEMLGSIKFNPEAMKREMLSSIVATDLADYLTKKGMPFRTAHELVGKIVSFCEKNNKELSKLTLWEFRKFSTLIDEDVYEAITLETMINIRDVVGGTSPAQVKKAIENDKKKV